MAVLTLRSPNLDPVEVPLLVGDQTREPLRIETIRQVVCSDVPWTFECPLWVFPPSEDTSEHSVNATYQLFVNESFVPTRVTVEHDTLRLMPEDRLRNELPLPFKDFLGAVNIEVRRLIRGQTPQSVWSAPLFVAIPEGPAADMIREMADFVVKGIQQYDKTCEEVAQGERDVSAPPQLDLQKRLGVIESVLSTYETLASYFRANARFKLVNSEKVAGAGRLTSFSESALRYVIEHPDELTPAPTGKGIYVASRNRSYQPRHVLVQTTEKSFDLLENRVVVGFLETLERSLEAEVRLIEVQQGHMPALLPTVEGYVCSAEALLGAVLYRLRYYGQRLNGLLKQLRNLRRLYAHIFPISATPIHHVPLPTDIFLSVPAYRRLYEGMVQWFALGGLSFSREDFLVSCFERSHLYELYCLMRQLESLSEAGAQFKGAERYSYPHTEGKPNAPVPNTYYFDYPAQGQQASYRLTLYYEPVIMTPAVAPENGIALVRTTPLSWTSQGDVKVATPQHAFYTPDFVLKVEGESSQQRWYVADAKYTWGEKVLEEETQTILFKYVFGLSPLSDQASLRGVWLFYPRLQGKQALPTEAAPWRPSGLAALPNLHYVLVSPEGETNPSWIDSVLAEITPRE